MTNEESYAKPQWKDAPEWANYLARDRDGTWQWFKTKPKPEAEWQRWNYSSSQGKHENAYGNIIDWKKTLEERPKEIKDEL